jgi:hypothetical protein
MHASKRTEDQIDRRDAHQNCNPFHISAINRISLLKRHGLGRNTKRWGNTSQKSGLSTQINSKERVTLNYVIKDVTIKRLPLKEADPQPFLKSSRCGDHGFQYE